MNNERTASPVIDERIAFILSALNIEQKRQLNEFLKALDRSK